MLEILVKHYKPIGKILLISLTFIIIYMYIYIHEIRGYLIDNWDVYRSHPLIMPIAGYIKPDEGKSSFQTTMRNYVGVISKIVNSFLKILMMPVYAALEAILHIMNVFKNILNKIRSQINVMRNFMFKLFEKMYIRLQNGMAAITYYFLKLREGMKRSYGIFNLTISTVEHSSLFFQSLLNGPVGSFGKIAENIGWGSAIFTFGAIGGQSSWNNALCFCPTTLISLDNGNKIQIENIQLYDKLWGNIKVIGKIRFDCYTNNTIYKLGDIKVTGSHFVKYGNKWIRVENHPEAKCIQYPDNSLICLITDVGYFYIDKYIFKDYLDTHSLYHNNITAQYMKQYLNGLTTNIPASNDLLYGFPKSTCITNADIIGIVEICPSTLCMYSIDNQLLSSNMLVLENGVWKFAYEHSRSIYIGYTEEPCVHYITQSEKIYLQSGLVLRDFTESRDRKINTIIDNYMDDYINKENSFIHSAIRSLKQKVQ